MLVFNNIPDKKRLKNKPTHTRVACSTISKIALAKEGNFKIDFHVFEVVIPILKNPNASLVYLYLYSKSINKNQKVFSTIDKISSDTGISETKVRSALTYLEEFQLLSISDSVIKEFSINSNWIFS